MRAKLHIPTEQYGFIEVEIEGTLEEILDEHTSIKHTLGQNIGEGHNLKEWVRVRNTYAKQNKITMEDFEKCNQLQKNFINEMKLVFKSLDETL